MANMTRASRSTHPPRRARLGRLARREERVAYLFLLPWFVGLFGFMLIPLGSMLWTSLTDEQLLRPGRFIGLANYVYMFTQDPYFYHSLGVTFRWIALTTPLYLIAGIALGLLLNQKLRGMHLFRTILYVPA